MNSSAPYNEILTEEDLVFLQYAQHRLAEATRCVAHESRSDPASVPVNPLLIPSLLVRARLSPATKAAEERRLAGLQDRKERKLRRKKRDRRYKPWTAKQATKRRQAAKRWAEDPFGCVLHTYGAKALDRSLWDRYIAPLWSQYKADDLSVVWKKPYGSKASPKSVYNCIVVHKTEGTVYDGFSQELYDLSVPKSEVV